jgi:hypothetical protein
MAEQGLAAEVTGRNALCEIRPSGRGLLVSHGHSLLGCASDRAEPYIRSPWLGNPDMRLDRLRCGDQAKPELSA